MSDRLAVLPLSRDLFLPYGDVLDASGPPDDVANGGAAQVLRDRARADRDPRRDPAGLARPI